MEKKRTIILTIIVFVALTILTMQQYAMSDGISSYGFPLTFYSYSGGKLDRQNTQLGFQPINLILDICIAFISVFLFRKMIKKR